MDVHLSGLSGMIPNSLSRQRKAVCFFLRPKSKNPLILSIIGSAKEVAAFCEYLEGGHDVGTQEKILSGTVQ